MIIWDEIYDLVAEIVARIPSDDSVNPIIDLGDFSFNWHPIISDEGNEEDAKVFYFFPQDMTRDRIIFTKVVLGAGYNLKAVVVGRPRVKLVVSEDELGLFPGPQSEFPRFSYSWERSSDFASGYLCRLEVAVDDLTAVVYGLRHSDNLFGVIELPEGDLSSIAHIPTVLRYPPDHLKERSVLGKKIPWVIPFDTMARRILEESTLNKFLECLTPK